MSEQGLVLCDRAEGSAAEVQRLIKFRSCRIDGLWAAECRLFQPTLWGELIKCRKRWKRCLVSMSVCVMCFYIRTFGECGSNSTYVCRPPVQGNSAQSRGVWSAGSETHLVRPPPNKCEIQRWRDKDTKNERVSEEKRPEEGDGS